MGKENNIYEQEFKIYTYLIDDNCKLTLPNLMYLLQEVAWAHTNKNQTGWRFLQIKNMFWVIVKLYIQIDRMPEWNETIRIRTWGRPSELIIYPREFEVYDSENNRIIAATSAWVILDKEEFKIQQVNLQKDRNVMYDHHVLSKKIPKIPAVEYPIAPSFFSVAYSDMDLNKHVNNTRYVLWAIDEYPYEFHKNHRLKTCNIQFISQAKHLDRITIQKKEISKNIFVSSVFTEDNQNEACRLMLEWEENNK
ncbi:MAG: hypothetical protein GX330_08890 [Bacteroidales bacterium]|nr:hypothetical protein [Bacteroidales bacterium]